MPQIRRQAVGMIPEAQRIACKAYIWLPLWGLRQISSLVLVCIDHKAR